MTKMTKIQGLLQIAKLNGRYTESFLVKRGISRSAVATAVHARLLTRTNQGVLESIYPALRARRLKEAVAVDIRPGNPVGILGDDNKITNRQVVKDLGNGKVLVVDPSNPNAEVEEVELDRIAVGDETETRRDDTSNLAANKPTPPASTSTSSTSSTSTPTI